MTEQAKVIIIGGGVAGCSAAYHLAEMGCTDVLLLEMNELTSGSTWHAAGNIPTYSTIRNVMKLQYYSTQLYSKLAADPETPIAYHKSGAIRLARNKDRLNEFHHVTAMANAMGIEYEMLSDKDTMELYPFVNLDDVDGVLWDPNDGDIDPSQLTQALAKKARQAGVKIKRFTTVTGISRVNKQWEIQTADATYQCETVINAAGYRAGEIAAMVNQFIPQTTMEHQYMVTESIDAIKEHGKYLPLLRDPDDSYYLRQERDGLILGPYEWKATPHWADGKLPEDFAYQLYPDDLDRLEWYIEAACTRVPMLGDVGIQKVINGPIPYTPDGLPNIGPAPGLDNFYNCNTFTFGICQGGGAGKSIAEWVIDGKPEWDLWTMDPRRYTGYATRKFSVEKAIEVYQKEYAIPFPYEERPAGRPARTTGTYARLAEQGAMFGSRGGWERATWFPKNGAVAEEKLTFESKRNWTDSVREECLAVMNKVGILDLSGFSKFELKGTGAADWLNTMIAGNLPKPGRIALSYFCHPSGGVWSEMTITRLDEDHFWLISAAAAEWHDQQWLQSHLPEDSSLQLINITEQTGTLVLAGPEARNLLSEITDFDLSNKSFPWLSCRKINLGYVNALALRVNYVGELGYELHIPNSSVLPVYDAIKQAGEKYGLTDFGMYAMESMRIEKCYRAWKIELDCEYSPLRSSLDRFVNLKKPDFIGKDAIAAEYEAGLKDVFVPMILEEGLHDAVYGCPILKDDEVIGYTTSGAYGHRIDQHLALGYVKTEFAKPGTEVTVRIFNEDRVATVQSEPVYDPDNSRSIARAG